VGVFLLKHRVIVKFKIRIEVRRMHWSLSTSELWYRSIQVKRLTLQR